MKPKRNVIIILGLFLITILIVDLQFRQMERLQVSVYQKEMSTSVAVKKEIYAGIFSGVVLTYGTSTVSHRLYGVTGLTISGMAPIIVSTYLKIVEFWRNMRVNVFPTVYPMWYLFGSCLGFILLAIEFTLRGINNADGGHRY